MKMLRFLFRKRSTSPTIDVPSNVLAFSYHKKSGMSAIVLALLLASFVELVVVHYFVALWSEWLAWGLSISSIWVVLTIIAQLRTIAWRPHFADHKELVLRNGMFELARIPIRLIDRIEKSTKPAEPDQEKRMPLQTCVPVSHNVTIHLSDPAVATLLYGKKREFTIAHLFVDEREEFCSEIQRRIIATK